MAKSKQSSESTVDGIVVTLPIEELIDVEAIGYVPGNAEVRLPSETRLAIKRLAMTLDARGVKLRDGSLVKASVPKTIAWLCEQFAASVN